ncbi:MAG: hypothetical protein KY453_02265, partial [Gemmatimonadetes bacterium]|nr:hypothetical protein [Gemmatimonadota bacterium]
MHAVRSLIRSTLAIAATLLLALAAPVAADVDLVAVTLEVGKVHPTLAPDVSCAVSVPQGSGAGAALDAAVDAEPKVPLLARFRRNAADEEPAPDPVEDVPTPDAEPKRPLLARFKRQVTEDEPSAPEAP